MAAETKWASGHLAGTCSTPGNAVGETDGTFTTDSGNTNWTSRWAMENPSGSLTGTQTITVTVRKDAANGNNPTLSTVTLYENGSSVAQLIGSNAVTSATGETFQGTFDASEITDPDAVEIEIVTTGAGGPTSSRRSVQVDSIDWTVSYSSSSTYTHTGSGGMSFGGSAARSFAAAVMASGALALGGVADVSASHSVAGSGGLSFGGAAVTSFEPAGAGSEVYEYTGTGGLSFGGGAQLSRSWSEAGDGGLAIGGSGVASRSVSVTGDGGLVFGGSAPIASISSITGTGGVSLAGVAPVSAIWSPVSSGGIVFGGSADATNSSTNTYSYTGSGGVVLSGAAPVSVTRAHVGDGSLVIAGSALESIARSAIGDGGILLAGAADLSTTRSVTGDGGITFGGTAPASFVPPSAITAPARVVTARPRNSTLTREPRSLTLTRPHRILTLEDGMSYWPTHHPNDNAPYRIRFRDSDGATVASITSATLAKINDVDDAASPLTTGADSIVGDEGGKWISGGVLGAEYKMTITILDSKGRSLTESGYIRVGHR